VGALGTLGVGAMGMLGAMGSVLCGGTGRNGVGAVENKADAAGTPSVAGLVPGRRGRRGVGAMGLARWWGWQRGRGGGRACWQRVPVPAQAERRLQALEGKESRAQRRLRELAQRVTALRERDRDTRRVAQQAKDGAERATTASGTLSQVSPGHSTAPRGARGAGGSSASPCPCAARTWRR